MIPPVRCSLNCPELLEERTTISFPALKDKPTYPFNETIISRFDKYAHLYSFYSSTHDRYLLLMKEHLNESHFNLYYEVLDLTAGQAHYEFALEHPLEENIALVSIEFHAKIDTIMIAHEKKYSSSQGTLVKFYLFDGKGLTLTKSLK